MNLQGELFIPQTEEFPFVGCWPPEKLPDLARSNSILENPQGNQLGLEHNWTPMTPNYNGLAQNFNTSSRVGQIPMPLGLVGNAVEMSPVMNHIPDSYHQQDFPGDGVSDRMPFMQLLFQGEGDSGFASPLNNAPSRDLQISQPQASNLLGDFGLGVSIGSGSSFGPEFANASYQAEKSWIGSSSADQLRHEQNRSLGFEPLDNCNSLSQNPYDLTTPSKPSYDLNISPIPNTDNLENSANWLHFTPVTPDLALSVEKQLSTMSRSITNEVSSRENEMTVNSFQCAGDVAIQQDCNELIQNILDSSSTAISTPIKDKTIDLGIDLNETPKLKPPKRRKHRPKVVVEGKPKRTRKPIVPKNTESAENRPAKRKYVRKKIPQGLEAQEKETGSDTATTQKTCKKALNFDLEEITDENRSDIAAPQEIPSRNESIPSMTIDHRATNINETRIMPSTQGNMSIRLENHEAGMRGNVAFSNQMSNGYVSIQGRQTTGDPLAPAKDKETADSCRQQINGQAVEVNPIELQKLTRLMQSEFQPIPSTPSKCCEEARGSKRDHSHMVSSPDDKMRTVDEPLRDGHARLAGPRIDKRTKIVDGYRQVQSMPFSVGVTESGFRKPETRISHDVNLIAQTLKQTYSARFSMVNGRFEDSRIAERGHNEANKFASEKHVHCIASGPNMPNQKILLMPHSHPEHMGSTSLYNSFMQFLPVNSAGHGQGQMLQASYICVPEKNHTAIAPRLNPASVGVSKVNETVPKRKGPKKKTAHVTTIDEIIYRFQNLDLNGSGDRLQPKEENALVLYNGGGTLVPHQGTDFIKKRKPRPKVDLDPETNRVWNLLMGKAVTEDVEGTDEKTEKWWEEERKVFRGRVDSFIARMHLVQGDRRFSRWKGSVVDSVIGVFLTQNVSDHLSSSAFMSMAARFPLKSGTQDEARTNIIDDEAPIAVINPDDTIKWHEPSETTNSQNDTTGTTRSLAELQNQSSEEELILSQDSFDSSITQVTGGIRSCSGSNSETEDPSTGLKHRNGQVSALMMEKSFLVQEVCSENGCAVLNENCKYGMTEPSQSSSGTTNHQSHLSATIPNNPGHQCMRQPCPCGSNSLTTSKVSELWLREAFSDESTSPWQSPASTSVKGPEAVSESSRRGEVAGSLGNFSTDQHGLWRSQDESTPTDPCAIFSTDLTNQQGIPVADPNIVYNQSSTDYRQEWDKMLRMESISSTESGKHAEVVDKIQCSTMTMVNKHMENIAKDGDCSSALNTQVARENKLVEANSKEQIIPSDHASKVTKTNSSRARNGKSESDKKNAIDWDNMRKKVEGNGAKKKRPKEAMDSLDYEAVRMANVGEISDTIKERGMNNMLAERMKEFLNRVVKDHGSIDLEWLRDVPPDKAKDYLLSIRGLGLKSVECVRLLTLHHLAFPVDTNVGRIAVRLGWVPLQPLPESLQLHLLELYPILETIQKYLWPRLCKLDQRTLYELHYQMITFGKVFCTKSKPNCNACPMRGECRHFASAFASARLALPAPEDRSIVSSTVSQTADTNPGVVIHPMPLPPPEQGSVKEVGSNTSCEPIIEEPATPEQECIEISESDIEDFEDPNEIPTIKLSTAEFRENLQTYMQNNMELQEADMSKALVALSPYIASIPMPKLKNVSRLRTEHQVYELPDSHPLLERFESREPDDPSPYLLAIWTPGETANSIQPSEKNCGSEPDKLCSDATCFSCNSVRETNSQIVRGTILIPCRTAMRGSFPLNGTYFQVNEMFADHESSLHPINVPREWIWKLPRRTVYFGTSVSTIFKGLTTEGIQYCFWKGFVCVRGFETATRAPRPLKARLHFPASKLVRPKHDEKK